MDALWFLKKRNAYVLWYFRTARSIFDSIKLQIEHADPPFDDPPYDDSGEPAFLEEWMDAGDAVDLLGLTCVSLLSDTLKVYFLTLEKYVIGFSLSDFEKKLSKKQGFIAAYKNALGEILTTDWNECPARFDIIEQIVLARNRAQHGTGIHSFDIEHDERMLRKHPRPFFVNENELSMWGISEYSELPLFRPSVKVTEECLVEAVEEVNCLAEWIDQNLERAWAWRAPPNT